MADPCLITNRRQLLIGISASAFAGGISFPDARPDPAVQAYAELLEIEAAFMNDAVMEDSEIYHALSAALEVAEDT